MEGRAKAALAACLLVAITGCAKKDEFVGTYIGTERMNSAQQKAMASVAPEVQKKVQDMFAKSTSTLTLNADATAKESTNGTNWSGTWTHSGTSVQVSLDGLQVKQMAGSTDGNILHYSDWTYTKQ